MKSKSLALAALAVVALCGTTASFAEPTEATPVPPVRPQYRGYPGLGQGPQEYLLRNRGESQRDYDDRWRSEQERRRNEPGAGPDHRFHRGDRLPPEYRSRQYVVEDWRSHQLYAPPRGYHWVQNGSDYMLVAIATGLVAELWLSP